MDKRRAITQDVRQGTYTAPSRLTVGQWLDIWLAQYLTGVKPNTVQAYSIAVRKHIKPALGAVGLSELRAHTVQTFANSLDSLSAATVRLICKVLHRALEKAVALEYIPKNPATGCALPRLEQKEIHPLDDAQASAILSAARGGEMEIIISVALFTGLRLSELLGLTWDSIGAHTINVNKQLAKPTHRKNGPFISPKNGKGRIITPAPSVLKELREQKRRQAECRLKAGPLWSNTYNLVFTTPTGAPLEAYTVQRGFAAVLASAGIEGVRFHDLRHTYAVNAIRAGDDIKTVQGNLGHATAAFTLDRYGHFTEQMKQASAARMEGFIKDVLNL